MKFYNLWVNDHWTDHNVDYGYSIQNPKPMTLEEAKRLLDVIYSKRSYVIYEIGKDNKPIIPKCRLKK
jgi:hypothetical protein